jgi:hypothetical protein
MTDPQLSTQAAPPAPRRQFAIQTFTAVYDPVEDRIRLDALDAAGATQSVWLTRRIADQVVPVLAKDLEAKTPQGAPAKIMQSMSQERVRQVRQQASAAGRVTRAVQPEPQTPSWLCKAIHFKRVPKGLLVVLTDDASVDAMLPLIDANQRALLDILRATYRKAAWDMRVFPDWMRSDPTPPAGQGAKRVMN